jgi:hypothetical protein
LLNWLHVQLGASGWARETIVNGQKQISINEQNFLSHEPERMAQWAASPKYTRMHDTESFQDERTAATDQSEIEPHF